MSYTLIHPPEPSIQLGWVSTIPKTSFLPVSLLSGGTGNTVSSAVLVQVGTSDLNVRSRITSAYSDLPTSHPQSFSSILRVIHATALLRRGFNLNTPVKTLPGCPMNSVNDHPGSLSPPATPHLWGEAIENWTFITIHATLHVCSVITKLSARLE